MRKMFVSAVVLMAAATGLWATGAQEGTFGPENAEKRILIAYESTRFKQSLVKAIIEELNNGSVHIVLADHKKSRLEGFSATNFNAVFITNSGAKAKVRPWVSEWITKNNNAPNIIVHTTKTTEWVPAVAVDSITSASLTGEEQIVGLAGEYTQRIRNRLK